MMTERASGCASGPDCPPGVSAGSISATEISIADNDTRGLNITPTALTVDEGASGSYQVALTSQPTKTVTVAIQTDNPDIRITPDRLVFLPEQWDQPQEVTAAALHDQDDVEEKESIVHTPSGGDYGASERVATEISVNDDEDPGHAPSGAAGQPAPLLRDGRTRVPAPDDGRPALALEYDEITLREGEKTAYVIRLGSQPKDSVTVSISAPSPASGQTVNSCAGAAAAGSSVETDPDEIVFTADGTEWEQGISVNITAGTDGDQLPDTPYELIHTSTSADPNYDGLTQTAAVLVQDREEKRIAITPRGITLPEGRQNTVKVRLNSPPSGEVTLEPMGHGGAGVTLSPNSLTFNLNDWATEQIVTLTAPASRAATRITLTFEATGGGYDFALSDCIPVELLPAPEQQVLVQAGLEARAGKMGIPEGESGVYQVVMAFRPRGNVRVDIKAESEAESSEEENGQNGENTENENGAEPQDGNGPDTEKKVAARPAFLTFTKDNWNTPQEVTVETAHDLDAAENDKVVFTHKTSGAGTGEMMTADVVVSVTEDDQNGIKLTPEGLALMTGGTPATYTVALTTRPATPEEQESTPAPPADPESPPAPPEEQESTPETPAGCTEEESASKEHVLVEIQPEAGSSLSANPQCLTFTKDNWDIPQTVELTAAESSQGGTVKHTASGGSYDGTQPEILEAVVFAPPGQRTVPQHKRNAPEGPDNPRGRAEELLDIPGAQAGDQHQRGDHGGGQPPRADGPERTGIHPGELGPAAGNHGNNRPRPGRLHGAGSHKA